MPKLSIIIPCYYNELNIPVTSKILFENEKLFPEEVLFEYVFVDDGSKDNTYGELLKIKKDGVKIIKLASNVGSHNAVLAGLHYSTGDCCVLLAADLQDPPELIYQMYLYWSNEIKLVIANRQDREEGIVQTAFSNLYHWLIRNFALKNIPKGGFDLVLFDKSIKDQLVSIKEKNTNITYLMTWFGHDYINIPYTRKKRELGQSKWTLKKKIKLFVDSFVAFSFFPVRIFSIIGLIAGLICLIYVIYLFYNYFTQGSLVAGWNSLMVVILFLGSTQLIGLGILGEYLWRILDEVRNRPSFIVEKLFE